MSSRQEDSQNTSNLLVEKAVLAVALSSNGQDSLKAWGIVLEEIATPLAFSERDHVFMATAITELWMSGKPCDAMAVYAALSQVRFTDACTALAEARTGKKMRFDFSVDVDPLDSLMLAIGTNAIFEIIESNTGSRLPDAIRRNAVVIAEHYRQRLAIARLEKALFELRSPAGRVKMREAVETATEDMIRLLGSRAGTNTMEAALATVVTRHNEARDTPVSPIPCWPMPALEKMCPMKLGTLVTLAATNGGGKTSLALQTATATAMKLGVDGCVGIVSREMAAEDLIRIIACRESGVSATKADRGELSQAEIAAMEEAIAKIGGKRITICDSMEKLTHKEVCAWARQQHIKTGGAMKLLVVDHIGCLDPESPRHSEYEKITAATRAFKTLATELRIVILILCQINRAGQRKVEVGGKGQAQSYGVEDFSLADLKGSGSLGDDSDQVVFICRQTQARLPQTPVKIKGEKNRWGDGDAIDAVFDRANGQKFIAKAVDKDANGLPMPYNTFPLKHSTDAKNARDERMKSEPQNDEDVF